VAPQPQHGDRATRAPIDYLYNCKASGVQVTGYPLGVLNPLSTASPQSPYPNYHPNLPSFPGVPIGNCPNASLVPPYIDTLTSTSLVISGRVGSIPGIAPPNGGTWLQWSVGHSCTSPGNVTVTGNVWFDCGAAGV
jgi:hypothetical protein